MVAWRWPRLGVIAPLMVLAMVAGPFAGSQAAPTTPDEGGVLYLTATSVGAEGDATCPDAYRYDMTNNASRLEARDAPFSPRGFAVYYCPTRFLYTVSTPIQLGATANVTLTLRCEPASATSPTGTHQVDLLLSQDPNEPFPRNTRNPELPAVAAPVVCDGGSFTIAASVPARNLTLAPTDTLVLSAWLRYANPDAEQAPLLYFVEGGEEPSRIEAPGLPSPADERGALGSDTRSRLYWTAEPTGVAAEDDACPLGPESATTMVRHLEDIQAGTVVAHMGSPGASCPVAFQYEADAPMILRGRVSFETWFECDAPTAGNDRAFRVQFARNGHIHGSTTQTAYSTSTDLCEQDPVRVAFDSWIDPPMELQEGDILAAWVGANYVTEPHVTSNLRYLVGPEHPSSILVAGLPSEGPLAPPVTNDTVDVGPPSSESTSGPEQNDSPGASAMAVLILAFVIAEVRRARR